jgi:hypothetical protein
MWRLAMPPDAPDMTEGCFLQRGFARLQSPSKSSDLGAIQLVSVAEQDSRPKARLNIETLSSVICCGRSTAGPFQVKDTCIVRLYVI